MSYYIFSIDKQLLLEDFFTNNIISASITVNQKLNSFQETFLVTYNLLYTDSSLVQSPIKINYYIPVFVVECENNSFFDTIMEHKTNSVEDLNIFLNTITNV